MDREKRFDLYSGFYWFVQGTFNAKGVTNKNRLYTIKEEHVRIKRLLKNTNSPEKVTSIQKTRRNIEAIKKAGKKGIELTHRHKT